MTVNPKKSTKSVLFMIRLFSKKNPFKRRCYENAIGLLRIEVEKQVFISNRYKCTTRNTYRPVRGRSQTTFTRHGRYVQIVHRSKKVPFCQHSYHRFRTCQRRGVGGQKSQTLVNEVCERPLTPMNDETFVPIFNNYWTYFIDLGG